MPQKLIKRLCPQTPNSAHMKVNSMKDTLRAQNVEFSVYKVASGCNNYPKKPNMSDWSGNVALTDPIITSQFFFTWTWVMICVLELCLELKLRPHLSGLLHVLSSADSPRPRPLGFFFQILRFPSFIGSERNVSWLWKFHFLKPYPLIFFPCFWWFLGHITCSGF